MPKLPPYRCLPIVRFSLSGYIPAAAQGTSNAYAIHAKPQKKMGGMDKLLKIIYLRFADQHFARRPDVNCVMGVTVEQPIASLVRRSAAF
jgi:hypothetical protein